METQIVDIELKRGDHGLGFNIRGGTDAPYISGDDGIFVTKIRDNGAASVDGEIAEGDKILEINGRSVKSVTHQEAVDLFVNAGDIVRLKVEKGAEAALLASGMFNNDAYGRHLNPSSRGRGVRFLFAFSTITVLGVALYFGLKKYRK